MKHISFYLDFISPYAYLAFEHLPQALEGCSYEVEYRPVLFAALLQHHAHKGPAEIEPKRAWTFRHVHWLAAQLGIPCDTPAQHPFNPIALLRLVLACGPNRRVVEAVLRHVWCGGHDANDPQRLADLTARLAPVRSPNSDAISASPIRSKSFGTTISPDSSFALRSATSASTSSEISPMLYSSIAAETPSSARP